MKNPNSKTLQVSVSKLKSMTIEQQSSITAGLERETSTWTRKGGTRGTRH